MSTENPYQTPESTIQTGLDSEQSDRLEKMAFGQKLVLYAVLLYLSGIVLSQALGQYVLILALGSLVLSLVGVFKILAARQSHIIVKIILFALMFIPLINMLTLLSINSRATKALREAGYKVGLMGASKQQSKTKGLDTMESPLLS